MKKIDKNKQLALLGEQAAAEYLKALNYTIIRTNWRYKRIGEIDIIAEDREELVFVEVKTRKSFMISALEAVDDLKQKKLLKLAEIFILDYNNPQISSYRFDVIGILITNPKEIKTLNHIKNAFDLN